jgi:ketosteroid isomerase-like protein
MSDGTADRAATPETDGALIFGDTRRTNAEQNIDLVRTGIDAFNARDFDTALAGLRDDVTWERFLSRAESDAPVVRGKDELRAVWESQVQAVDIRLEVDELVPDGENRVVAPTRMVARGSGSEIALSAAVTWIFTFDPNGLIASVEVAESQR